MKAQLQNSLAGFDEVSDTIEQFKTMTIYDQTANLMNKQTNSKDYEKFVNDYIITRMKDIKTNLDGIDKKKQLDPHMENKLCVLSRLRQAQHVRQ